jgi:hypothetical protein
MADDPMPGYQSFWADKRVWLKSEYRQLLRQFPDADAQLKQLFKVVCDIENVAGYTPASVVESEQGSSIIDIAEENRQNFSKALNEETLLSALYGTYAVELEELKALLKASRSAGKSETIKFAASQDDGLKEVRWRKRHSTNETATTSKNAACHAPRGGLNRNFFHP